jgi:hypothetical protein
MAITSAGIRCTITSTIRTRVIIAAMIATTIDCVRCALMRSRGSKELIQLTTEQ